MPSRKCIVLIINVTIDITSELCYAVPVRWNQYGYIKCGRTPSPGTRGGCRREAWQHQNGTF